MPLLPSLGKRNQNLVPVGSVFQRRDLRLEDPAGSRLTIRGSDFDGGAAHVGWSSVWDAEMVSLQT